VSHMLMPVVLLAASLGGCGVSPAQDLLQIDVGVAGGVQVDTDFSDEVEVSYPWTDASVAYPADVIDTSVWVDVLQYRLDYLLTGSPEVPALIMDDESFGGVRILQGTSNTFELPVAGEDQVNWIVSEYAYQEKSGFAELTMEGLDQDERFFSVVTTFQISFGAY
jgi:hypothetical protein